MKLTASLQASTAQRQRLSPVLATVHGTAMLPEIAEHFLWLLFLSRVIELPAGD
jgi:hypothetical protein